MPGQCENHGQFMMNIDKLTDTVARLTVEVAKSNVHYEEIIRRQNDADADRKRQWEKIDTHGELLAKGGSDAEWLKGDRKFVLALVAAATPSLLALAALGIAMYMKMKGSM